MLAFSLFGFSAFAQSTNKLLDNYINVKNSLVKSDSKAAADAATALFQCVKSENNFSQKNELLKATEKLSKASGIEKQRAALNDVSSILWQLVKNSDAVKHAVYYQYCPMKKAYWLSNEKEIKNPYYGSSMLTCGKVAETKK